MALRFKKGSQEAKDFMSSLRELKKANIQLLEAQKKAKSFGPQTIPAPVPQVPQIEMGLEEQKWLLEKWRVGLLSYAKFFCPEWLFEKTPDFHKEMYELLLKELFLLFVSFRGSAKSTICSKIRPLHCCAFEKDYPILILSLSESFAINEIALPLRKKIENNERFIQWFGRLRGDPWGASFFTLKNGVSIEASGIGGQIRGGRKKLIVIDDVEDDESVLSVEQRRKLRARITKELIPKLTPDGQIVFVGSNSYPLSYINELVNEWRGKEGGWTVREYAAYRDGVQEEGYELWPEMWSHQKLQQRKAQIGSWAFEGEFMNNPISLEGNAFAPSSFKYFKNEDLPAVRSHYITIDPAFSDQSTASFGVIMDCAVDGDGNLFVNHYFHRQVKSGDLINAFMNIYRSGREQFAKVGVEEGGPQKGFFQNLVSECQRNGLYPNFVSLKGVIHTPSGVKRQKTERNIATLQPRFEAGRIYLKKDQTALIAQLASYPSVKSDDLVDALAYQFEIVQPAISSRLRDRFKKWTNSRREVLSVAGGY